jgi:hypothetical protein
VESSEEPCGARVFEGDFALNPRLVVERDGSFAALRRHGPWSRFEMRLGWEHLPVQNAHNTNSARLQSVKDDVLADFMPVKT